MHAHAQTAPPEWFLSTPGLRVVPWLLSEICWLRIQWSTFMLSIRTSSSVESGRRLKIWQVHKGNAGVYSLFIYHIYYPRSINGIPGGFVAVLY